MDELRPKPQWSAPGRRDMEMLVRRSGLRRAVLKEVVEDILEGAYAAAWVMDPNTGNRNLYWLDDVPKHALLTEEKLLQVYARMNTWGYAQVINEVRREIGL